MSDHSRRSFLKRGSVGAAVVGAAAVVPAFSQSADAAPAHPLDSGKVHGGSFTVWVKDASTGKIAVLVNESEVVYTDRVLAARLARLAARAK